MVVGKIRVRRVRGPLSYETRNHSELIGRSSSGIMLKGTENDQDMRAGGPTEKTPE